MMQRTGSGPIARKVLIVDSGLAGTGTAARRVRALADELGTRNIAVIEATSYDDGLATVVSDTSIHCILLNWTQGGNDVHAIGEATELLRTVRKRNARIPIFLMASRAISGTLSVEVMTLADEFIWILDDTATFISGRVQGAIERGVVVMPAMLSAAQNARYRSFAVMNTRPEFFGLIRRDCPGRPAAEWSGRAARRAARRSDPSSVSIAAVPRR
jgi:hypothetical protein